MVGWKNWPIIYQWLLVLLLVLVVVIGIATSLLNIIYNRNISGYARQQMSTLLYVANSVDEYFDGLTEFTIELYANSEVLYKLFNEHSTLQENTVIVNRTETFFDSRPDLSSLTFYFTMNRSVLRIQRHRAGEEAFVRVENIDEIISNPNDVSINNRMHLSPALDIESGRIRNLTYKHLISDWAAENTLSILSLSLNTRYLGQRVRALGFGPDDIVMVLSNGNKLMHFEGSETARKTALDMALNNSMTPSRPYFVAEIEGNDYLVVHAVNEDVRIVHAISLADISAIILPGGLVLATIGGALLIFALIIVLLLSRHVINPVKSLIAEMERVGSGQAGMKLGLGVTSYEIKKLTSGFNLVTDEMSRIQNEQLKSQLAQKSAELHALQTQIHPHFLYNTLQTIQYMALKRKAYEINSMVQALADIMEYALRGGHHMVPLGKEIQYVNKYLVIQKYKYMDRFVFEIDVPENLTHIAVPKMFLHTLTENSFVHGFSKDLNDFKIKVRCTIDNGYCVIEVEDNGCGINSERLDNLNYIALNGDSQFNADHVGIANVAARLKRMYHGKAKMILASKPYKFTKVTICIPIEEENPNEADNS